MVHGQPEMGMMTRVLDSSGMRLWATSSGPTEVLDDGEGNLVWVIEEEEDRYQLQPQNQI